MTSIPDDAIRVRLAVDVPCQQGRDATSCAAWYGFDVGCPGCRRDLTCTVVTDIEVEPSAAYGARRLYNGAIEERRRRPGDSPLWREVEP